MHVDNRYHSISSPYQDKKYKCFPLDIFSIPFLTNKLYYFCQDIIDLMIDAGILFHNLHLIIHFYSCLTSVIKVEDFLLTSTHVIRRKADMGKHVKSLGGDVCCPTF